MHHQSLRLGFACLLLGTLTALPARAEGRGEYGPVPLRPKDAVLIEKSGEMEELFVRRGHVLGDGPETRLVQRIGARIAPAEPTDAYQRFRFAVIDNPVPNAFALPDGQIYVHTGLLALLENEAQLASILAHESMHVEGHHSIVHSRQARKKAGGMLTLSIALGQIGDLINIALIHAVIGYGRDLEEEADRRAVERVLEAGYDPREMPRIFELLEQDPEGDQITPAKATWMDHPLNAQRAAYTAAILEELEPRIIAEEAEHGGLLVGEEAFLGEVESSARETVLRLVEADRPRTALSLAQRIADRWPDDPSSHYLVARATHALHARTPTPTAEELTKKAKREKHREQARLTRYERERIRLRDQEALPVLGQNRAIARQAYEEALRLDPRHEGALAWAGRLAEDEGRLADAGRYYVRYLDAAPDDAAERPVVVQHLAAVNDALRERRKAAAATAPSTAPEPGGSR